MDSSWRLRIVEEPWKAMIFAYFCSMCNCMAASVGPFSHVLYLFLENTSSIEVGNHQKPRYCFRTHVNGPTITAQFWHLYRAACKSCNHVFHPSSMSRLLRLNLKCKFIGEALRRRVASDDGASAAGGHRVIPSASAISDLARFEVG